jgi:hypothetical protein
LDLSDPDLQDLAQNIDPDLQFLVLENLDPLIRDYMTLNQNAGTVESGANGNPPSTSKEMDEAKSLKDFHRKFRAHILEKSSKLKHDAKTQAQMAKICNIFKLF